MLLLSVVFAIKQTVSFKLRKTLIRVLQSLTAFRMEPFTGVKYPGGVLKPKRNFHSFSTGRSARKKTKKSLEIADLFFGENHR